MSFDLEQDSKPLSEPHLSLDTLWGIWYHQRAMGQRNGQALMNAVYQWRPDEYSNCFANSAECFFDDDKIHLTLHYLLTKYGENK